MMTEQVTWTSNSDYSIKEHLTYNHRTLVVQGQTYLEFTLVHTEVM